MDYRYSKTTNAFYVEAIHGKDIPADSVPVSNQEHAALMKGQSEGKVIRPDNNGRPVLTDPPGPTPEQIQAAKNAEARAYLSETDWYVVRHAETGQAIPQEITQARAAARDSIVE
jgi:hypothetical protein